MVRRNEFACRDEWSRSLWQPRDSSDSNGDLPFQRPAPGPLPPTLAENLRSVLDHDTALAASAQGEDVLLSEARIVSEAHESWEPEPRPFPGGNFDPRTAIFRAREAYRERARTKATADRQSAGAEAKVLSSTPDEAASVSPEDSAVEPGDYPAQGASEVSADSEYAVGTPKSESWSDGLAETEPIGGIPAFPTEGEAIRVEGPERPSVASIELNSDVSLPAWWASESEGERAETEAAGNPADQDVSSTNRRAEVVESDAFPDWYRADLPRICRTCRDYRPSADGQRGWCANSWAFTHRRLVLEDDPAPCQSAIGDWWLPVDDVWLVAADVSSHGRATPLLDRLTAKADQQRRRS